MKRLRKKNITKINASKKKKKATAKKKMSVLIVTMDFFPV